MRTTDRQHVSEAARLSDRWHLDKAVSHSWHHVLERHGANNGYGFREELSVHYGPKGRITRVSWTQYRTLTGEVNQQCFVTHRKLRQVLSMISIGLFDPGF